jgi:hypothetical protein
MAAPAPLCKPDATFPSDTLIWVCYINHTLLVRPWREKETLRGRFAVVSI